MTPTGCRLADIGTDHGYLPVYLLQRERIQSAIAADIGAEPLTHARRTAEEYGVDGRVVAITDRTVVIETSEDRVRVEFLKSAIGQVGTLDEQGFVISL